MNRCPQCQATNPDPNTTCHRCGAALTPRSSGDPTGGPLFLDPDLPLSGEIPRVTSASDVPFELESTGDDDPLSDVFTSAAPLAESEATARNNASGRPRRTSDRRRRHRRPLARPRLIDEGEEEDSAPLGPRSRDATIAALQRRLDQFQDETLDPAGSALEETLDDITPETLIDTGEVEIDTSPPPARRKQRTTPDTLPVFAPRPKRALHSTPSDTSFDTPPPPLASRRHPSGDSLVVVTEPLGRSFDSDTMRLAAVTTATDSADEAAELRLAFLAPSGQVSRLVPLRAGRFLIGRDHGDLLLSDDPTVSPWHAQLQVRDGRVVLSDMDSSNGVFLLHRGRVRLQDKDTFIVGQQHFVFRDCWDAPAPGHATPMGTPDYDTPERLLLIREGGQVVGVYILNKSLVIGSGTADLSFPADPAMSPEHAVIRRSLGHFTLTDLSQSGVFVRLSQETELEPGQTFQIGRTRFRVTT